MSAILTPEEEESVRRGEPVGVADLESRYDPTHLALMAARMKEFYAKRPEYMPAHREIVEEDSMLMSKVGEEHEAPTVEENPGVRLEMLDLDEDSMAALLEELWELKESCPVQYEEGAGDTADTDTRHTPSDEDEEGDSSEGDCDRVQAVRVSGREELPGATLLKRGPWGYGNSFDIEKVTPFLRAILDSILERPDYDVAVPRDITINYFENGEFGMAAHVDPPLDGSTVFVLNLISASVFTLSPPASADDRTDLDDVACSSWTDSDIDVLLLPGVLANISGAARTTWRHGIRPGREVESERMRGMVERLASAQYRSVDTQTFPLSNMVNWFGSPKRIVPLCRQRISVIMAFVGRDETPHLM